MNVPDSSTGTTGSLAACEECGATSITREGFCISCLLREGLEQAGEPSAEVFENVLVEADVPDASWRLGNYEILGEIGRGGMGVIYRARQRHSGRIVALKRVLAYNADSHETLVRFRREAEATAKLDHPNILPIYEVGESADGLPFFSMKFATGGSLRAAAPSLRDRPNACVLLLAKVARAIDHAHEQGLLHRDLQPGNILLDSRGEPLVSDFGLAKWMTGVSDLTQTQTSFGTPGYIAPEQAESAAGELTPAADIYSLGAILFYLLAGRPPFVGANVLSVIRQAIANPAPKLRSLAPRLDRDLETICARCLERDPKARYQAAAELADDLERWLDGRSILARPVRAPARLWRWSRRNPLLTAAAIVCLSLGTIIFWLIAQQIAAPPPEKSIAVLPFDNLSDDKENSYFAAGVQDEILSNLAQIADLKVISRTSTRLYEADQPRNSRQIGRQLGVAHLLEGNVQRVGHHLRINVQLIDAQTDAHLWAQSYDGDLKEVVAIQSQIARTIAQQLQARLSAREKAAIAQPLTIDLRANALYQEALAIEHDSPEDQSLRKSIGLLEKAVARDPEFALAYCALSRMHLTLYFGGYDHTSSRRSLAHVALQNATRLEPESGEVHLAAARYWYHGFRDYDRARHELELARRVLPNDANMYFEIGIIDRRQGRWSEAIRALRRAVELDPRNVQFLMETSTSYEALHRYAEASEMSARALAIAPHDYWVRIIRASQAMKEQADLRPLRHELDAILAEEPESAPKIVDRLFLCAILERDRTATDRALLAIPPEGVSVGSDNFTRPREWFVGYAARTFGDAEGALAAFTAARAILERRLGEKPDYAPAWGLLGLVDAALGRKEEAIGEGRRACELLPVSQDAILGRRYLRSLAKIYAWTGEKELALEQIAKLSEPPPAFDYGDLQLDPDWDPLRGDPRFEALVARMAPDVGETAATGIPEKSIAVLPFENLSDDKQNAYFAAGVQDEIVTDLAKVADLKVISRTSTRPYEAGKPRNLRQIGQQLGVANILEGSVQKLGQRIRIHAQLIDTRSDTHLWAQTYDRDVADLFAIQSEIAQTIAAQLHSVISDREKKAIALPPTTDLVANDLYTQARLMENVDFPRQLQAIELLQRAVARDPRFVLAYCALARVHLTLVSYGYGDAAAHHKAAQAAIENAARIQPEAGEVHLMRAHYLGYMMGDYDHARAELELARRALPNNAAVYFETAVIDRRQGRWAEALINMDRAVELDPQNEAVLIEAAASYYGVRRYAEGSRLFDRAIALTPKDYFARIMRAERAFSEWADTRPLRAELDAILAEDPGATAKIADSLLSWAISERDAAAADRAVAAIPTEGLPVAPRLILPREYFAAGVARTFHRPEAARRGFEAVRPVLQKLVHEQPDLAAAWSKLGLVEAALGRKEEAIEAGRRACEIMPMSRQAAPGASALRDLAAIYARVGEKDQALDLLATCASKTYSLTYGSLKLNPDWDSLRGDPRFERIVASLAPSARPGNR